MTLSIAPHCVHTGANEGVNKISTNNNFTWTEQFHQLSCWSQFLYWLFLFHLLSDHVHFMIVVSPIVIPYKLATRLHQHINNNNSNCFLLFFLKFYFIHCSVNGAALCIKSLIWFTIEGEQFPTIIWYKDYCTHPVLFVYTIYSHTHT